MLINFMSENSPMNSESWVSFVCGQVILCVKLAHDFTYCIVSLLLIRTRTRGPSAASMRDFNRIQTINHQLMFQSGTSLVFF